MKLNIEEITRKISRYSINNSDLPPVTEKRSELSAGMEIAVSRRDADSVVVEGELKGHWKVACDRCGELVEQRLLKSFSYLATTRKEEIADLQDIEVKEEDINTLYLEDPVIDLGQLLHEQAYLAMPVKTLCNDDCKGICPECGVVLNRSVCSCTPGKKDSPFAVLGKLRTH